MFREVLVGPIPLTREKGVKLIYRFEGEIAFGPLFSGIAGIAPFVSSPRGTHGRGSSPLAAFEDLFEGRLWLPAKELSFHHELSISVYHPSQPPDVLL